MAEQRGFGRMLLTHDVIARRAAISPTKQSIRIKRMRYNRWIPGQACSPSARAWNDGPFKECVAANRPRAMTEAGLAMTAIWWIKED